MKVLRWLPLLLVCSLRAAESPLPETELKAIFALETASVALCDTHLQQNPRNVRALSSRGDARLFLADFAGSKADYEQMIQVDPSQDVPHWRLGIVYYFLGDFEKGAAQFAKYHAYDARDRENGVWHFFCVAKQKSLAEARKAMLPYAQFDRHPFPDVYEMLAGTITPAELEARLEKRHAASGRSEQQQFFADLYLGMFHQLEGRQELAVKHLAAATANSWGRVDSDKTYMWQVARLLYDVESKADPLVEVSKEAPSVVISLRYATKENLTGAALYPENTVCRLERSTAEKLGKAADLLAKEGLRLKIWDAYRSTEAQQQLWKTAGKPGFVAEPKPGQRWSWHCYGRAVDVTLADLEGKELAMPSKFDDFTDAAKADYQGSDPAIKERLGKLQAAMAKAGFEKLSNEWWHFSNPVDPVPPLPESAKK